MPFCDSCARYLTPTAMTGDGSCPSCGKFLDPGDGPRARSGVEPALHNRNEASFSVGRSDIRRLAAADGEEAAKAPWHFKLLITALVLYLGWRIVSLFL